MVLIFSLFLMLQNAKAENWIAFPSLYGTRYTQEDNGSLVSQMNFYLDTRIDYRLNNGLLFGAMLTAITGSGNLAYSQTQTGLGASIGYTYNAWFVIGTYFPLVNRQEKSGGNTTTRGDGSGFQFDGGYLFTVTPTILVGPMLTYKQVTFLKQKVNNLAEQDWTYVRGDFIPFLSAVFLL